MPKRNFLYNETNDIANNDLSVDVYVPSLVWNRSYLVPKRPNFGRSAIKDAQRAGRRLTLSEVRCSIDAAILSFLLCEAGRGFKVEPSIGNDLVLFAGVYDGRSIATGGAPECLSPRLYMSEHNRLLEADERALVLRGRYATAASAYDVAIKVHVRTNLFTVSTIATPVRRDDGCHDLKTAEDFTRLTIDFWDTFSADVMKPYTLRRGISDSSLRGIFADSRGIIVSSANVVASGGSNKLDADWGASVIRSLTPILSPADEHGCTATYMLDRRAVSLTSFGSQTPRVSSQGRTPLTFVICVHADHARQDEEGWARLMGQVIGRTHTITTLRLAALLDLKLLRAASVELAKVDDLKRHARDCISDYERDEIEGGAAHKAVDRLRQHFGSINSGFLEANAAGVGLTFRIESSKYYIDEFKKNVEQLHLSPVEGYQSYSQTIDKNIAVIFEFISRLGVRYDRLLVEMAGIEQSFSTVQSRHTSNQIAELQRNGETILIGFLVPYYLLQIIAHVFGGPERLDEPHNFKWRMINATVWMFCMFVAYFRFTIANRKPTSLRSPVARVAFGLKTFAAFLCATTLLCLLVR